MRKWASESCGLPPPAGAPALLPGRQLTSSLWPRLLGSSPSPQAPPWTPASRPVTGSCVPHTLAGSLPRVCVRKGNGLVTQTYSLPQRPHRPLLGEAKAHPRVPLNSTPTFSSSTSSQPNLWLPRGPSPVLRRTHGPNYPRSAWLIHGNSQPHPNTKAPSVTKLLNGINPIPTMCSLVRLPSNTCFIIAFRPSAGLFQ